MHLDGGAEDEGFVDDHSLRGMESEGDTKERDADEKAQNALAPIHRTGACERPPEEAKGCCAESGIMVL